MNAHGNNYYYIAYTYQNHASSVIKGKGGLTSHALSRKTPDTLVFFSPPAPPRFLSRLESACLIEGEDILFSCATLTIPLPRIRYGSADKIQQHIFLMRSLNAWISGLAGGWKMVENWLIIINISLWVMLGAESCLWRLSGQQRQILDNMSVRYKTQLDFQCINMDNIFAVKTKRKMFCFV